MPKSFQGFTALPIARGHGIRQSSATFDKVGLGQQANAHSGNKQKVGGAYAWKLLPHPQVLVALGFLKTKPRPITSSLKSISTPLR